MLSGTVCPGRAVTVPICHATPSFGEGATVVVVVVTVVVCVMVVVVTGTPITIAPFWNVTFFEISNPSVSLTN